MTNFAVRNLKIFFRDKSAVFFSLLASFIIIGLYVLFLGDVWSSSFEQIANPREVMDNWIMAGLLAVTSVTTTMGAFGTMINDKEKKIDRDFLSSPLSRKNIAAGYLISSYIIGLIMTLITLVLAEIYIVAEGGHLLTLTSLAKMLGLILLADLTNTAMVFFIVSFFKSQNAFATASTVIGTLIGFITGIYLPIGTLPESVQWVVKLFPTSHAAMLMRQTMMEKVITEQFSCVQASFVTEFKEMMGITFDFGGTDISAYTSILILVATAGVFFTLAIINISRKKK